MARIRSIKPDFWESEDTATLPMAAALTYSGLWNYSDDEGRGRYQPSIVHSRLHGLRPDGSMVKTKAALRYLVERKLIVLYEVEGIGTLYYIPSFKKHQHPDRPVPSKFPPPQRVNGEYATSEQLHLVDESTLGEEGRGGGRGSRKGEEGGETPSPLSAPPVDPGEEAQILDTVGRYGAWAHPSVEKKTEGVRELRALGLSHDYIRNGAQVNKPADAGFWDIVKALKAAGGKRPTRRANIPGHQDRDNVAAYSKAERPPVLAERREDVQKRQDEAASKVDRILGSMDEDELGGWQRDAEAAAAKAGIPAGPLREAWIKSELRRRVARENGIEGL